MKKNIRSTRLFCAVAAILCLQACSLDDNYFTENKIDLIDNDLKLGREDYERAGFENRAIAPGSRIGKAPPPIPSAAPILSAPRPPQIGETKLVSISVTDDVPLKDVLIELARLAKVDVELGPGIDGGISFIANEKPFNQVVSRIADLAGLRYRVRDGVLRVERDNEYVKNYQIDFLNVIRNSTSTVNVSTDVLSAGTEGGGGSLGTGSASSIDTEVTSDFWDSLNANIALLLATVEAAGGNDVAVDTSNRFVVNRQAGVISVSANDRQHSLIQQYLNKLRRHVSAQVLIEAKIVEVELFDEFQSGIDWTSALGGNSGTLGVNFSQSVPSIAAGNTAVLDLATSGLGGLDIAVNLASRYGTTRTLSSPRLHATNNQQAVLTFAENQIFFDLTATEEDAELDQNGNAIDQPGLEISGERVAVPIGIIMSIVPSVNLETNEITLNVRPTLSRQVDTVEDPVFALLASDAGLTLQNSIPIIEVRELDSVMKVKSGQILVIGGLMEESSANTDLGTPWFSELPVVGNAFKSTLKERTTTELIIFIRATIVNSSGHYDEADRNIYETFTSDPRPIAF